MGMWGYGKVVVLNNLTNRSLQNYLIGCVWVGEKYNLPRNLWEGE
jgi:hypothetical protein